MTTRNYDLTPSEARFLLAEAIRLSAALATARLQSANRLAAIRAALAADADGESNPLEYLRDQLADESLIPGTGSGL